MTGFFSKATDYIDSKAKIPFSGRNQSLIRNSSRSDWNRHEVHVSAHNCNPKMTV